MQTPASLRNAPRAPTDPASKARKGPKWATVERSPRDKAVDAFIAKLPKTSAKACTRLRALVHEEVPEAREAIYWGVPFFFGKTPFAYISPGKKHVTLGFTMGAKIDDPSGSLKGTGRTTVRKANLHPGYPLPEADVRLWLRKAAAIDRAQADEC
jgi:hypothetical protein